MPQLPAQHGRPRDLTHTEWSALVVIWRHQRLPLAPVGMLLLCFSAVAIFWCAREFGASTAGVFAMSMTGAWGVLGVVLVVGAFYTGPERPEGRARRVGRIAGRVVVGGKPARVFVGPVPVVIPAAMGRFLPQGAEVDVEILPPLEDEPRTRVARHVISVDHGRHWIGDPGMTAGWGKAVVGL